MKKHLLLAFLLYLVLPATAQKITYQKSLSAAMAAINESHPFVFITINAGGNPHYKLKNALETPEVIKKINDNCISYLAKSYDSLPAPIRHFHSDIYPVYLLVDAHGNLANASLGISDLSERYLTFVDKAKDRLASGQNVSAYLDRFNKGDRNPQFLRSFIALKQSMWDFDNADLLNAYADQLAVKAFDNYATVMFMLRAGPVVNSKAYTLTMSNRKLIDSIYKNGNRTEMSSINARMMTNSQHAAIDKHDVALAQATSNMHYQVNRNNFRYSTAASRDMQQSMLDYYAAVKDTASYFNQADNFYDIYYMHIGADSIKKINEARKLAMQKFRELRSTPPAGQAGPPHYEVTGYFKNFNPDYALNEAAWQYYLSGTTNPQHLMHAILWSKHTIAISPKSEYYDTLAHLLYRMEFYAEAVEQQTKAVEVSKKDKANKSRTESLKKALNKIKSRTL